MSKDFYQEQIRNFAIIAHIDHGKSTLADRLLEATGTVAKREMRQQFLDDMELEREKGITIKLKTVRMVYPSLEDGDRQGKESDFGEFPGSSFYILNLIDTPGHVDFSYEVSRSLAACEGALLLVDASQGVQAQTVSNAYKALDLGLTVIPVVNKIDLDHADPGGTAAELVDHFGFAPDEIIYASGKEGVGTGEILEALVERIPAPSGNPEAPLRALVFDSFYDEHKGVIALVRIVDGGIQQLTINNQQLYFLGSKQGCAPLEIGYFIPEMTSSDHLLTGEVGYIATGLKDISKVRVGDTLTQLSAADRQPSIGLEPAATVEPLPGYQEPKAVVFANIFPVDKEEFAKLVDSLRKLKLNDASLEYQPISSAALGRGFELGLLGVLHLEVVKERLEREYGLDLVVTAPTVEYKVRNKGQVLSIKGAVGLLKEYDEILEPWALVEITTPYQFLGEVMKVIDEARGRFADQQHLGGRRAKVVAEIPLAELISNFYDQLKSASSGFASLDWKFKEYRQVEAGKLEVLVNREVVEPFSRIVIKDRAYQIGRKLVKKLKEILPREQFAVPLQAAFNGRIIVRETIPAMRKDVTAKLYGGDQTRKDKLLKKQKEGKKRLARIGKVRIPKEVFFSGELFIILFFEVSVFLLSCWGLFFSFSAGLPALL